ncbi:MAG: hypothetical protein QOH92_199 [Chloroflexota bacterium]|nr:hypothetical protein [Chloroflexota bacterium]
MSCAATLALIGTGMKRNDQAWLRQQIVNLRLIPASLVAGGVGLGLLLLAGWSGGLLGQVLTGIGVAALTAAFVGLFSDIFLRRQVLAEVLAKLQLKEDVVAAGILEVGRWDDVMPRLTDFFVRGGVLRWLQPAD